MSLFGNFFGTDPQQIQTTQTQTANPLTQQGAQSTYDWLAAAQAQPYSNMPMQQVAGFTPDQQAAFEATRAAQGQANPWFTQAGNLVTAGAGFSPDAVAATYKDLSTPVLASLYDQFGQQRSQMAGNLRSAAGGTGADRINVGLADLAKQQSLAAGQTESGLLATAINTEMQKRQMMQSAGALTGQLGGQQQAATYTDIANLYGMGGQQQQLSQAQLNAQYQYGLGQFMYPSQLAQMGAGITAGLAPALGGTTTGTKTVPGQPLGTTLANLGMTGLGIAGATGGFGNNGWVTNLFSPTAPVSPYPTAGVAGGGRVYDEGGRVDNSKYWQNMMMAGLRAASRRPSFEDSTGGRVDPYSILKPYNLGGMVPHYEDGGGVSDEERERGHARLKYLMDTGGWGKTSAITRRITEDQQAADAMQIDRLVPRRRDLGGMVPHYEDGGEVPWALDDRWEPALELAGSRSAKDEFAPAEYASAAGIHRTATPEQAEPFIQQIADRSTKLDPKAHDRWAAGVDDTNRDRLPPIMTAGMRPQLPAGATAYADDTDTDTDTDTAPRQSPYLPSRRVPIPPLPDYGDLGRPDKSGEIYRNPWMALMGAGLGGLAAQGERTGEGFLKYPGISAVAKGSLHGVEMLREQQKSALEENRAELELRKSLEAAQHWRTDLAQRQEQEERTYREPTAAQKATINQAQQRLDLEAQTPKKIGVNPDSGLDVMGVRDPKDGRLYPIDPRTGEVRKTPLTDAGDKPGLIGEDYLKTLSPARQEELKQINEGRRAPPPTNPRTQQQIALSRQLALAFPDFDGVKWKSRNDTNTAFSKGPEARVVTSTRTVVGHMHDAMGIVQDLAKHNVKTWNKIENAISDQLGGTAVAQWDFAKTAIADELARVFTPVGSSHEGEKQRWLGILDSARTPEQFKAIFGTATKFLASRFEPLKQQYATGMYITDLNDPRVKAKAGLPDDIQEKYEKVKEWSGVKTSTGKPSQEAAFAEAQAKINSDPRTRDAVIKRMKDLGYKTDGL